MFTANTAHKLTIFLLGIIVVLLIFCNIEGPFEKEDRYCMEKCILYHPDEKILNAEWHGNDEMLGKTRCACTIKTEDGEYTYIHLVTRMKE